MATSTARLEANRRNAQLSTGPKTVEGKARSRRNSLKHGMTGAGIVLPDEEEAAVAERLEALQDELAPKTTMGQVLVQRVALLSVRLERSARQEASKVGEAMRAAPGEFDDRRLAEVEHLLDWITAHPATNARRLRRTPEGVERMIRSWLEVGEDLDHPDPSRWGSGQWQRMENLNGRRTEDFPLSRDGALFRLLWGEPMVLGEPEVDDMDMRDKKIWARDRIRERIAAQVVELRALLATFDLEALAKDRLESARRAIFDSSKEGILARKYEAAIERGLYRALKELREVEAQGENLDANPEEVEDCEAMGSSFAGSSGDHPGVEAGRSKARSAGSKPGRGRENGRKRRRPWG